MMARGFVYLAAVMDWFSRKVLAWRLSITMDAAFCIDAVEDALARHGKPEIFNTPLMDATQSTAGQWIRAASSPVWVSRTCCSDTASGSAWTAKAHGGTMSEMARFDVRASGAVARSATSFVTTEDARIKYNWRALSFSGFTTMLSGIASIAAFSTSLISFIQLLIFGTSKSVTSAW